MIFVCIILIIIAAIAALSLFEKEKAKMMKKMLAKGNDLFKKFVLENNIVMTKTIDMPSCNGSSKFIVDDAGKNVYYLTYKKSNPNKINCKKFKYEDVLRYQIIKDNVNFDLRDFDEIDEKEQVKNLILRIFFRDNSLPYLDITFFKAPFSVKFSSLKDSFDILEQFVSIMNVVTNKNED